MNADFFLFLNDPRESAKIRVWGGFFLCVLGLLSTEMVSQHEGSKGRVFHDAAQLC
jgi:hypothetical protein